MTKLGIMFKKAFTLIELMITMVIIALMLVVAVPGFGKYGERQDFILRMSELKSYMESTQVLAANPEAGAKNYFLYITNISSVHHVTFYKTNSGNTIKDFTFPFDDYYVEQPTHSSHHVLMCTTPATNCCIQASFDSGYIECDKSTSAYFADIQDEFIKITNRKTNQVAVFKVGSPFRVELTITSN